MRLSYSESIAFFLLFSPFGGISADEGDIDFVEQVDYSKRDNEKNLRQMSSDSKLFSSKEDIIEFDEKTIEDKDVSELEYGEKSHGATEYIVHKDCSSFTLTFNTEKDVHFHIPTECPHHMVSEEEQAVCDPPDQFPMKCTFHLIDHSNEYEENYGQRRMVTDLDGNITHTSLEKVVSKERDLASKSTKKSSYDSKRKNQFEWAAESIKKLASSHSITTCTPSNRPKRIRGIDCDMCFAPGFSYPCNCNCRGWTQVVVDCYEPCSGEFIQEVGLYCFKPCYETIKLHTGCGLTPNDRTCRRKPYDCFHTDDDSVDKYAKHGMNSMDVVLFFCSADTISTMKKAVTVAVKVVKTSTRKAALNSALKQGASEMTRNLINNPQIRKELSQYSEGVGKRILEQGAILLLASNLDYIVEANEDIKSVVLEIAKAVDPAGMVFLGSGFIPGGNCDEVTISKCPEPKNNLEDKDVVDAIDDIDHID